MSYCETITVSVDGTPIIVMIGVNQFQHATQGCLIVEIQPVK